MDVLLRIQIFYTMNMDGVKIRSLRKRAKLKCTDFVPWNANRPNSRKEYHVNVYLLWSIIWQTFMYCSMTLEALWLMRVPYQIWPQFQWVSRGNSADQPKWCPAGRGCPTNQTNSLLRNGTSPCRRTLLNWSLTDAFPRTVFQPEISGKLFDNSMPLVGESGLAVQKI